MENQYLLYFFGPQADYYLQAAEDVQEGKIKFNPAAFLCGVLWMGYRKMYVQAFITLVIILAESFAEDIFFPALSQNKGFGVLSPIIVNTIIGFIANRLYINFAKRQVEAVVNHSAEKPDEAVLTLIQKKGGVAWYGPILVVFMILVMAVVLFLVADLFGIEIA
ncbi:DUF2628 domain-containing protein [Spirosoma soli]|uniref:DUF2628 domain-containing protein n=1 Tax=Spirosoma soli TaxID=1770529 RepID=A0ABW5M1C6_9BACT